MGFSAGLPFSLNLLLLFAMGGVMRAEGADSPSAGLRSRLASARAKQRVLLLFTPSEADARYTAQKKLWSGQEGALADYDLLVLSVAGAQGEAGELRRRYEVEAGQFAVLLLGKDGQVAERSSAPVPLEKFLRQIDQMPMRREEVRAREKGASPPAPRP